VYINLLATLAEMCLCRAQQYSDIILQHPQHFVMKFGHYISKKTPNYYQYLQHSSTSAVRMSFVLHRLKMVSIFADTVAHLSVLKVGKVFATTLRSTAVNCIVPNRRISQDTRWTRKQTYSIVETKISISDLR